VNIETRLHLIAPYLPTDRFRALLKQRDLPLVAQGAALMVDISGFTPLTTRLVGQHGAQRAGEELRRLINPMFEAIGGQIFQYGGSIIRFLGDGFTAWFDDSHAHDSTQPIRPVPAVIRALAAGQEIQKLQMFFRGLRLKIYIGAGMANRWVVGLPTLGLSDVLSGPAVQAMVNLAGEAQPDQVLIHHEAIPSLRAFAVPFELTETGNALLNSINGLPDDLNTAARRHRWPAWSAEGDLDAILGKARLFVDRSVRERVDAGMGTFGDELRYAMPMFVQVQFALNAPTDPQTLLNNYVCAVQEIVQQTGGRLVSVEVSDKGSVIFLVFGAPISLGDDALRAMNTALALRELAFTMPYISAQRVGVSRGMLYSGTVGGEVRHEYSIIGDETNIAARLVASAEAGQILVSSNAREDVTDRFSFRELPPVYVKGRELPITIFEPLGRRTTIQNLETTGKFVGRETELATLRRLAQSVVTGYPHIVSLEGVAGIGKSRLANELVGALRQGIQVAQGSCANAEQQMAYRPIQALLYKLLNLSAESTTEANLLTLSRQYRQILPNAEVRFPLLADVLGLPIEATATTQMMEGLVRREATAALVTDIFYAVAERTPLLLMIEDVHWLDEVSEALLVDLIRQLSVEAAPIFLLLTYRPPISDGPVDLFQALHDTYLNSTISLPELSFAEVKAVIDGYADAVCDEELATFVYDRSQGNPFFVRAMVDALRDHKIIAVKGKHLLVLTDLQQAQLPKTVQGIIQSQIDRLPELDKLILKVAAVIGREFQSAGLQKALPVALANDEFQQRFHELQKHEFIYRVPDMLVPIYRFRHAITQEVAYEGLLFGQRELLHHSVGMALESTAPDAFDQLAYHFMRTDDEERAWHYSVLAGQKAFSEYANQAAIEYFAQAIRFSHDIEERFNLRRQQASLFLRTSDLDNLRLCLEDLATLLAQKPNDEWRASLHLFWASLYMQTSNWLEAAEQAQAAIAIAEQSQDTLTACSQGYSLK
jgi:adenylate cyclase